MRMDANTVCHELDNAKSELEKLKNDLKYKKEEYDWLQKLHNDEAIHLKEGKSRIKVLQADISEKSEEMDDLRSEIDKLQSNLIAKDCSIKQLRAAHELTKGNSQKKIMELEEEKKGILETLDAATFKIENIEAEMKSLRGQSEVLRKLVSDTQKKNEQLERNAIFLHSNDDAWLTLEDKNIKIEEELKWKKEQFKHLQEAHEKLRKEFSEVKKEWERELSTLIDKVCSLEEKLDSETRIAEDCRKRLMMSNQALAREKSKRKTLEVELSEFKSRFHNAFIEFEDTKLQLENFSSQRDNEIAFLASSLSHKEIVCQEMQYKIAHLEQENQELLESLKETREDLIRGTSNSQRRRAKTAEKSKVGLQELERKNAAIRTLQVQLEQCFIEIGQLRLQKDESDLTLVVLKSMLPEMKRPNFEELEQKEMIQTLQSKLENCLFEIEHLRSQKEEADLVLLQMKTTTGVKRKLGLKELQSKEAAVKSLQLQIEICFSEMEQMKLLKDESDFTVIALKSSFDAITENSKIMSGLRSELEVVKSELKRERLKSIDMNREFSRQEEQLENARRNVLELQDKLEEKTASLEVLKLEQGIMKRDLDASREKQEFIGESLAKACDALDEANADAAIARKNVIYTKELEQKNTKLQKEVRFCRERLKEALKHEIHFKQQATLNEKELKDYVHKLRGDLDVVNSELVAEILESHSANFESWIWKSIAEKMKGELEEGLRLRKEVESSLIAQIEDGESFKRDNLNLTKEIENLEFLVLHKELHAFILKESCESAYEIFGKELEMKKVLIERLRGESDTLLKKINEMSKHREKLTEALMTFNNKMLKFSCDEAKFMEAFETIVCDAGNGKENEFRFSSSPKLRMIVHGGRLPFTELN